MEKYSDKELMRILKVDKKTLERFKEIRENTIKEAKKLGDHKGKIKVLGVSGSGRSEIDKARESSNSEELLKRCLAECKKLGAETEFIRLRDYNIKFCQACYSTCNTHCHFFCSCYPKGTPEGDDMSNILYDKVLGADAIIFATPVNNFSMSTMMKTFLDRSISLDGSLEPADPKFPKDKELNIKHMKFVELNTDQKIPGSGMLHRFMNKTAAMIVTGHEEGASMVMSSLFMTLNHFGMIFPPFCTVYAMSSDCVSTYKDKRIVLGICHDTELNCVAENVMTSVKITRGIKTTDWKYDYRTN
jgi:multimeric flavodoxin WrbA